MTLKNTLTGLLIFTMAVALSAQSNLDEVHLFQNFFRDATIASNPYGEGVINYSSYEYGNKFGLGVQGGYGINSKLEVNANLGFASFSPKNGDGSSGLTDLTAAGRYLVHEKNGLRITAGGLITFPIGSKDIGYSRLDFGAFGAARYGLSNGMVITGTLGLDFNETTDYKYVPASIQDGQMIGGSYEESTAYESSLVLAGGVIYPYSDQLAFIGELMFKTDVNYGMISGGVDYLLQNSGRFRGALGLGIDDGAPDIMLLLSYLMSF